MSTEQQRQITPRRSGRAPRRWKLWLVTVSTLYPLLLALSTISAPLDHEWPTAARLALLVPIAVALMVWVISPWQQRRFGSWMSR
ncbi:hypothetical protein QSJ18_17375 [Gordonia sp. ABSL1-1]|uniref:hypothetical protein n=1 Tax=Gordonia sp. ABSL1-1 TaxID=3053923 RepID=UPI0025731AAE|nr:hypothetical protein [Gordonia sp. ABSL1-1]MDL9938521.1 hypothetical protein [Gordonia sp. ABSL1-1]